MEQNGATDVEEFANLRTKSKRLRVPDPSLRVRLKSEVIEIPAQLAVNVP
jgi:hypothetical protein